MHPILSPQKPSVTDRTISIQPFSLKIRRPFHSHSYTPLPPLPLLRYEKKKIMNWRNCGHSFLNAAKKFRCQRQMESSSGCFAGKIGSLRKCGINRKQYTLIQKYPKPFQTKDFGYFISQDFLIWNLIFQKFRFSIMRRRTVPYLLPQYQCLRYRSFPPALLPHLEKGMQAVWDPDGYSSHPDTAAPAIR